MRALIVTNMWPTASEPALGQLRARPGRRAARARRRRGRGLRLPARAATCAPRASCAAGIAASASTSSTPTSGSPRGPRSRCAGAPHVVTLHGTDLRHPRSRRITRAALPFVDLVAAVSPELAREVPGAGGRRRVAVLPCGVDLDRFTPIPRAEARERLGLAPDEPCLLFPADPARAVKRFDRAQEARGRHATPDARARSSLRGAALRQRRQRRARARPRTRASASPCSRRSRATCPCWRRRSASTRPRSTGSPGRCARRSIAPRGRPPLEPHLQAADPRVAGRDRAALWSARQHGATRARRVGRGATVARRGAEFRCRFRMKGPLHAIRRRRSERPANGVETAQAATEAPTEAQPTAGLSSAPPPAASEQAPPTAEPRLDAAADRRAARRRRGPRRPGADPRPPELPPARPAAPAPALPAPRARAGLPRPRRPRLRPAPLLAGQHDAGRRQARGAGRRRRRAARARARARRPPPADRAARAGHLGVPALRRAARQRGALLPVVRDAGARRRGRSPRSARP